MDDLGAGPADAWAGEEYHWPRPRPGKVACTSSSRRRMSFGIRGPLAPLSHLDQASILGKLRAEPPTLPAMALGVRRHVLRRLRGFWVGFGARCMFFGPGGGQSHARERRELPATPVVRLIRKVAVALGSLKPNNCKLSDTNASDPGRVVLSVARTASWDGRSGHSSAGIRSTVRVPPYL